MSMLPRPLLLATLLSLGVHGLLLSRQGWMPIVNMPDMGEPTMEMVLAGAQDMAKAARPAPADSAAVPAVSPDRLIEPYRPREGSLSPEPAGEGVSAEAITPAKAASEGHAANPPDAEAEPVAQSVAEPGAAVLEPGDTPEDSEDAPLLLATRLPQQARIDYALFAYGTRLGTGRMLWQQTGSRYRLSVELSPLIGPALQYESAGRVLTRGLQPESFAATRNDKTREWARFDWQAGLLRYGEGEEKTVPLQNGAVDWLSLSFDLASRGLGSKALSRQITTGKKVYVFSVQQKGEDEFEPKHEEGRAQIVQARKDREMIEIWLAPSFANLPVRISKQDEDRTLSLRASRIEINGTVAWRLP